MGSNGRGRVSRLNRFWNVQTTAQLHSSHMIAKQCSKFSKPGFNSIWTMKFQRSKLDLEMEEEPEIKLPISIGSSRKQEFQKNIYYCFINFVWITTNCEKFFKRWEYGPPYLPHEKSVCQEATLRTGHGTIDWCQIRKGVRQGYTLSPCSFNLHAEYIMQSAGLDEAQAGIKIARKNNQ